MLPAHIVRRLLTPFGVDLSDEQVEQLLTYLELLLRWNKKINLTAIRTPEECVTRHFGESFLLARALRVTGSLLDVGSGAGFPGLALKILVPELSTTLLEPVGKKRAFLREAASRCQMSSVEVVASTIQEASSKDKHGDFDLITIRAVGNLDQLLPYAFSVLRAQGSLCLWVGSDQAEDVMRANLAVEWRDPLPIPLSQKRRILVGKKLSSR